MTVAVVTDEGLTSDELELINRMHSELVKFRRKNEEKWRYYDGEVNLKNMEIAVPSTMISVEASIGW